MNSSKKILVTGCAGFIGSNFVRQFKLKYPTWKVVGLDNFSTGRRTALDRKVIFYRGSILNAKLLNRILAKHRPEYIFHFAALPRVSYSLEHPRETSEVNIIGTITLLEAARQHGVKRFIYSSSSSVYGNTKKLPTSESKNFPHPESPYAVQKYTGEPFCRIYSQLFGLDTVCLRYFNVFGPGQYGDSAYATVVAAWLEAMYFPASRLPFIEGDGKQSRDFCYVDNVVQANLLAMSAKTPLRGQVFNVANGDQTTINEVKKLIEKYTGRTLKLERRPQRLGDVRHTKADITKAKKILGYRPQISFAAGLQKTIAWFELRKSALVK